MLRVARLRARDRRRSSRLRAGAGAQPRHGVSLTTRGASSSTRREPQELRLVGRPASATSAIGRQLLQTLRATARRCAARRARQRRARDRSARPTGRASRGPRPPASSPLRAAFSRSSVDRVLRPVGGGHVALRRGRDERRDAEPAAELGDAQARRPSRQRAGERQRGRPQLGPVRQELVVGERRPRRSAPPAPRAGAAKLELADRHVSSRSRSEERVEADGEPGRQRRRASRAPAARRRRTPRARSCRGGSSAPRPCRRAALPGVRRGRQTHRVDRHVAAASARPSPSRSRTARRASSA